MIYDFLLILVGHCFRYNVQWYMAPLHIQKMMLFLLQKGTKAFHLMLGGIFIGSMESAATVNIYRILKLITELSIIPTNSF